MEWMIAALFLFAAIGFVGQHFQRKSEAERKQRDQKQRRERIERKYADSPFLTDIINGMVRPGMSVEQLVDAWGQPVAIDERVLKTKVVHTYKYAQTSARSFRQKVKVENGIVVGWSNT